jgi:hypothetical protein
MKLSSQWTRGVGRKKKPETTLTIPEPKMANPTFPDMMLRVVQARMIWLLRMSK